jgi:hypothetical protein
MLNPLRSEAEAFRFLLWVGGVLLLICLTVIVVRAL